MALVDKSARQGIARDHGRHLPRKILKIAIALVVLASAVHHIAKTWMSMHHQGIRLRIAPGWFVAGIGLYLLGLILDGVWFWRVMRAGPAPVAPGPTIRAYLISHLGKYVPGKALVVVMRVGLMTSSGSRVATATIATFYETLTMMAAGGLVAALGLGLSLAVDKPQQGMAATTPSAAPGELSIPLGPLGRATLSHGLLGLSMGAAFLSVTSPIVFPRLARLAVRPLRGSGPEVMPRITARLWLEGLAWTSLGWILLGISQVMVLKALCLDVSPATWRPVIGSVALATVAGFVVPVSPGGLGVREWVLWTSLGSALDHNWAVIGALALRLAWVIGEASAAAVLWPLGPPARRTSPVDPPASLPPAPDHPPASEA